MVFSIDHTRELMAPVFLASCSLFYILARRLGFSWPAAAAAVLAMALTRLAFSSIARCCLTTPR